MFQRKITTQFFVLFAAILLGTLALLATSTYTSSRVEQRIEAITNQTLIVTKQLHQIRHAGSAMIFFINEQILQSMLTASSSSATPTPSAPLDLDAYETQVSDLRAVLSQYSRDIDTYFPDETETRDSILLLSGALTRSTSTYINHTAENKAKGVPTPIAQQQQFLRDFKTLEAEFLTQIDAALDYEENELRERIETLNASMHASQKAVWAVFGLLFALVLFAGQLMLRKLINRINALHQAVTDIGAYDLSSRVDESGSDELSELAARFNAMAQRLQDMNARRDQDEQKLKCFNEELHTLVEAQTRELRTSKDRAETANKAKSRFLSAISHELRTPLNAILGYAQILNLKSAKTSPQDTRNHLSAIIKSSETLLALIDEVLTLSSLDKTALPIQLRATGLQHVLRDSIDSVKRLATHNHITIVNEVDTAQMPRVLANKDHLHKVFVNLLSNGVKYNHDHGRIVIQSQILHEQNKVRIIFKDTGTGFREDYPGQVLEPFERLMYEGSSVEGAGVGLTIVKRFLANMDGELGYRSTPDQGSEFWVDLPTAVDLQYA